MMDFCYEGQLKYRKKEMEGKRKGGGNGEKKGGRMEERERERLWA